MTEAILVCNLESGAHGTPPAGRGGWMAKESVLVPFHISWPLLNLPVAPFGSVGESYNRQTT
jgi:hypothetical protein